MNWWGSGGYFTHTVRVFCLPSTRVGILNMGICLHLVLKPCVGKDCKNLACHLAYRCGKLGPDSLHEVLLRVVVGVVVV